MRCRTPGPAWTRRGAKPRTLGVPRLCVTLSPARFFPWKRQKTRRMADTPLAPFASVSATVPTIQAAFPPPVLMRLTGSIRKAPARRGQASHARVRSHLIRLPGPSAGARENSGGLLRRENRLKSAHPGCGTGIPERFQETLHPSLRASEGFGGAARDLTLAPSSRAVHGQEENHSGPARVRERGPTGGSSPPAPARDPLASVPCDGAGTPRSGRSAVRSV